MCRFCFESPLDTLQSRVCHHPEFPKTLCTPHLIQTKPTYSQHAKIALGWKGAYSLQLFTFCINHRIPLDCHRCCQEALGILFQSLSKAVYLQGSIEGVLSVDTVAAENRRMRGFGSAWILQSKSTCVDQGRIMMLACSGHGWGPSQDMFLLSKQTEHNRTEQKVHLNGALIFIHCCKCNTQDICPVRCAVTGKDVHLATFTV